MSAPSVARRAERAGPPRGLVVPVGAACLLLIAWGWSVREEHYVDAGFGLGYVLGIAGTACMVALLGYSVRKRLRALRSAGRIRGWLEVHMALGLLGPVGILFHANFQLGSLNSTLALACVLLVASSGVVGRLLYPKVHQGLSGRRATLDELRATVESRRSALGKALAGDPGLLRELKRFESFALRPRGWPAAVWRSVALGRRARRARRASARALRRRGQPRGTIAAAAAYVDAIRRVSELAFYERTFAMWHAFHLPLCFLLFGAAAVHVVAVHMY